jgi:hypothetical protein
MEAMRYRGIKMSQSELLMVIPKPLPLPIFPSSLSPYFFRLSNSCSGDDTKQQPPPPPNVFTHDLGYEARGC